MENKFDLDLEELIDRLDATLNEDLFDVDIADTGKNEYSFEVDGFRYEATVTPAKHTADAVIGVFRLLNNPMQPKFTGDIKQYLKDKEEAEMGDVSIGKSALKVIGRILTYFSRYIKSNKPKVFIFHARNDSRAEKYDRIGKKLSAEVGYNLTSRKDPYTGITEYRLVRPDINPPTTNINESIADYVHYKNYL